MKVNKLMIEEVDLRIKLRTKIDQGLLIPAVLRRKFEVARPLGTFSGNHLFLDGIGRPWPPSPSSKPLVLSFQLECDWLLIL